MEISYKGRIEDIKTEDDISLGTPDHNYDFSVLENCTLRLNQNTREDSQFQYCGTKEGTIVNNESAEIIRMLNTEFNSILPSEYAEVDLVPKDLESQIDELNSWIYDNINNGVYKAGFASKQEVYAKECQNVFDHLDKVEAILEKTTMGPRREIFVGQPID